MEPLCRRPAWFMPAAGSDQRGSAMLKRYPLLRYVLRKLLAYVLTIWGAFTITFFLFRAIPGDPVSAWAGALQQRYAVTMPNGTAMVDEYRKMFGLDKSPFEQYTSWMYNAIVHQRLGPSFVNFPRPVEELLAERLPWTIGLLSVSIVLAWVIGILLGTIAGWKRGGPLSSFLTNFSVVLSQVPPYLIAIMLVLVFGYGLRVLPAQGAWDAQYQKGFNLPFILSVLQHAILPATSLIIVSMAGWILSTRSLIVTILGEDYLLYAEAKGLPERELMLRYGLRNALLPQATGLALSLGFVMSGQLLIENLFLYPGMGELLARATGAFDFNTIMGCIMLSIVTVMTASLIVDLLLPLIDPRVRATIS
jgi:peptide/nickel transport system permease protein